MTSALTLRMWENVPINCDLGSPTNMFEPFELALAVALLVALLVVETVHEPPGVVVRSVWIPSGSVGEGSAELDPEGLSDVSDSIVDEGSRFPLWPCGIQLQLSPPKERLSSVGGPPPGR